MEKDFIIIIIKKKSISQIVIQKSIKIKLF